MMLEQLTAVFILLFISGWVRKDANSRGMNGMGWSIFVFLILIIGLPTYLLMRKPKMEQQNQEEEEHEHNSTRSS